MHFLGYGDTARIECLRLKTKKIAVAQSTSGDMPETGLNVPNQDGDSIVMALAKRLAARGLILSRPEGPYGGMRVKLTLTCPEARPSVRVWNYRNARKCGTPVLSAFYACGDSLYLRTRGPLYVRATANRPWAPKHTNHMPAARLQSRFQY